MARIMEAKAIISGEDRLGPMIDKLGKKFEQLTKTAKTAEGVDKLAAALEKVKTQLTAIEKFNAAKIGFQNAQKNFAATRIEVEKAARAMQQAEGPSAKLAANLRRAQLAVTSASRAFEEQKVAVLGAKRQLEGMGVSIANAASHQTRLATAVDRANNALQRQHRWRARIAGVPAVAGAIAGAVTGGRTAGFAKKSIVSAAEFDIATRKQRAFTDVAERDQVDILTPQAKRIGQDTQFTNLDVVKAQTTAMQGLPTNITGRLKAEVASGIMENVKNYALVMEADLATSAEAIRSYLQATGKDISTKEKALAEANKATNQIVKMAKLGGMSDEDVQGYLKFAMPTATAAGVSPEAAMAIAALARRGGLRGDEAGVFMRATASKLVAPTKKGLTALNAAGIDYNKFVHMPDKLDVDRLEGQFAQDIGTKFNASVRARLQAVLADKKIIGDRGAFTEAVTSIVADQFPKTKKGQISAADRQKIAKAAGNFHRVSASTVDAEALLDKVMMSNMTLAQLNAFLTDKHGGKGSITQRQREEYIAARQALQGVGDDPDFAKKKADEIMGGFGGAYERLKGSIETLTQSTGEAAASTFRLKTVFDTIGGAIDWVADLPKPVLAGGSVVGGAAAIGGASWLAVKLAGGFGLSASAVALDGAAAALTTAAGVLGGGKVAGAAASTAAGAAGASIWSKGADALKIGGGFAATYVPYAAVAAGLAYGGYALYETSKPFAGMPLNDRARAQRGGRSMRDVYTNAFNEDRARLGLPLMGQDGGTPIKAELHGQAEVKGEARVTIDIPGLPSRTVGVPLNGALNANGPGSLGKSSPDASAKPSGVGHN